MLPMSAQKTKRPPTEAAPSLGPITPKEGCYFPSNFYAILKMEPLAVESFALCAGTMEASLDSFPDHGAF
jgi:hypothetical protein